MVATIQSLMVDRRYRAEFTPFYFDLVINDEAHRPVYGDAREVVQFFQATRIGLTAIPKAYLKNIDLEALEAENPKALEARQLRDTYHYLGCQPGFPTFRYDIIDAVKDPEGPFLCLPKIFDLRSDITTKALAESGWAVVVNEQEENFKIQDLERRIFTPARNRLMCEAFLKEAQQDPSGEKVDVLTFRGSFERDIVEFAKRDAEMKTALAEEDDDAIETIMNERFYHRPEMFYSPDKLVRSYGVPAPTSAFVYHAVGKKALPAKEEIVADTVDSIAARFNTPRHIIDLITALVDPQPGQRLCDPACGTAGFLISAFTHILRQHTKPADLKRGLVDGALLKPAQWRFLEEQAFTGFDNDANMVKIAILNLYLHQLERAQVSMLNPLTTGFGGAYPGKMFDCILANPPFSGKVQDESILADLNYKLNTRATELLFLRAFQGDL